MADPHTISAQTQRWSIITDCSQVLPATNCTELSPSIMIRCRRSISCSFKAEMTLPKGSMLVPRVGCVLHPPNLTGFTTTILLRSQSAISELVPSPRSCLAVAGAVTISFSPIHPSSSAPHSCSLSSRTTALPLSHQQHRTSSSQS